jgi:hypothetical protein
MVLWPDNTYEIIKEFKLGTKQIIKYNKENVQRTGNISSLINDFIKDKRQFDSKIIETQLIADLKVDETPDFNYYSLLPHGYLPHTPAIAIADINKDGWDDIYVGGLAGEEKYLLVAEKDAGYKKLLVPEFTKFRENADAEAKWSDVNNDGNVDLIVQSSNHPFADRNNILQPRLYLNRGDFKFEYVPLPNIATPTSKVFMFDFNGDGLKDIFLSGAVSYRNYTKVQPAYVLLNKGKGQFVQAPESMYKELSSIPFIKSIESKDIDNNGKEDLIIAAEWQPLNIFLNNGKKLTRWSSPVIDSLSGWWQTATIADINMDGKADLIAGNWGVNNKYNVATSHPLYAFNSDLDKDGKNDLILSYNYQGKYYPFRPKNDLEQELPYLKKEWLSYVKMADKTTGEIFKDKLDNNSRLAANTFKSIFISDILGSSKMEELPYLLQQSPILSILPSVNKSELTISGNFWGVIPYEGRYDALGLATLTYDFNKRSFSKPQYWINPQLNFMEINFMQPIKKGVQTEWVILTCEGKLMLLSDKNRPFLAYAKK